MAHMSWSAALVATVVIAIVTTFAPRGQPTIAQETVQIGRSDSNMWQLSHDTRGGKCAIRRTGNTNPAVSAIELDNNCRDNFPIIAAARYWANDRFGNVTLTSEAGERVAEFAIDESSSLQSVYPSSTMLVLQPVR
jgi:hypothetical protein